VSLFLAVAILIYWSYVEQDKLARFERIKKAIIALEKQQKQILKQGELAPFGAWVARYQVQ
jgi:hypothetical protein